jgi:NADP-dependent aldehyde dehydrogenase
MPAQPVLIDGQWVASIGSETFSAVNPNTRQPLPESWPVSPWAEIERAIDAADAAFQEVLGWPGARFAAFLEKYAGNIEAIADKLVSAAHTETGLPVELRLKNVELPRTTNQLRQAAAAARDGSWAMPTIDTKANIRSMFGQLGPIVVFGPNNFPFAFNGISGGDFAAAVAAGNPVIAKGHSSHPLTTRLFAEAAHEAAGATEMPSGFVQLIYRSSHQDGCELVSHPKIGGCGYTGARQTGLTLKRAADAAGKPIYLELSSINPVVILPGALAERLDALVDEFSSSCLMGAGQFCTNPGLVVLLKDEAGDQFVEKVAAKFSAAPAGTLLGEGVLKHLKLGVDTLIKAGAERLTSGEGHESGRICHPNTLLRVTGSAFLNNSHALQTEAFGNCSLMVVADDVRELQAVIGCLEGNLTGGVYTSTTGADDATYNQIAPRLRQKVGRLLNDKMPTGVAVSAAMNHGGPFPATGHPGFTAVGIPGSIRRFAMLQCYDNVRAERLPALLRNENPTGAARLIDGRWTTESLPS